MNNKDAEWGEHSTAIRGLGEIALRVSDLETMARFYADAIRLQPMSKSDTVAFFRVAEGVAGHTQVLALFDRKTTEQHPPQASTTTVDHLALAIELADFENERTRLESLGLRVTTTNHGWVQWRSLYVKDPEGNVVELVCFDPSIEKT